MDSHSCLTISYPLSTATTTPSSSSSLAMDWFSWLSRTSLDPSLIYDYGLTLARNELQLEDATYFNHELLQSMGISIAKHRLEILKLVRKQQTLGVHPKKNHLSGVIKRCLRKCMSKLVFNHHGHDMNLTVKSMPEPQEQQKPQIELNWHHQEEGKWIGALVKEEKPLKVPMYRSKTIALSGPLDGRMHEKIVANKAMKLSGPLDGRMHERIMMNTNRSPMRSCKPVDARFTRGPRLSGPLDSRLMAETKSPRLPIVRHSDAAARVEPESPIFGLSPNNNSSNNKTQLDFDFDDDHTLWPSLFQDLKPT